MPGPGARGARAFSRRFSLAAIAALAALCALGCQDRASEEDCWDACKNSVELSFWEDFAEAKNLDERGPRARERALERGERKLSREMREEGALYETVDGCTQVCRRTPTPPEVVACQMEAESVAALNACAGRAGP